ncbi:MAG: site-specific integrase [Clostridia bacterium]|nr:site-specific integrase [Clostridia bacterium]
MAQRRSNGEGSISYSATRKEYIGSIRWEGGREYFYSGKNGRKSDVIKKMNQWKIEHATGKKEFSRKELILEDRIMIWLNSVKKPDLKPSSYDRLESIIRCQIIPRIGGYKVNGITEAMIKDELLEDMKRNGLGESSVKKAYMAMNAYLKYETYHGVIPQNPMGLMKVPRADTVVHDEEEQSNTETTENVLTTEEMVLLKKIAYFRWNTGVRRYPTGAAMVLIMYTGLRMGEAIPLTWSDIDFEKKMLSVNKNAVVIQNRDGKGSKQELVVQKIPKTKSSIRTIPLTRDALDALRDLRSMQSNPQDSDYVIATKDGRMIWPRNMLNTLHRMCEAAGIRKIGLHTLRHPYVKLKTNIYYQPKSYVHRKNCLHLSSVSRQAHRAPFWNAIVLQ